MPKIQDLSVQMTKRHRDLPCIFCEESLRGKTQFFYSNSRNAMLRLDEDGDSRIIICKECSELLIKYLTRLYRTGKKALYHFCVAFDICYHEGIASELDKLRGMTLLEEYFRLLNLDNSLFGKSFSDSIGEGIVAEPGDGEARAEVDSTEWALTEEDEVNRREILSIFHYDPFEKESIPERKKLLRSLVVMTGPEMVDDLVRQRAAVEIVRSFARIDQMTEVLAELNKDPASMVKNSKEIKTLLDTKNKETDMITKFSKDHGFAERYALAKSRGSGSLSAIQRDMEEYGYDNGKVNLFDIKTSTSMQQAADISSQAVMKQLSLSEADYVDMLKQQREYLVKIEQELLRAKEEARLAYKQVSKQELLKELATELSKKGLQKGEIFQAVLAEIKYDDDLIKTHKKKQESK